MEHVTVVGNITKDPEMRVTQSGASLCNFSVAANRKVGDVTKTSYYDVTCWRTLAENVVSLEKGTRVIIAGRLEQQSWEANDGTKRTKVVIIADEVGPSLRWATAAVTRTERSDKPAQPATRSKAPASFDEEF